MQPIKILSNWLQEKASENHYLFSPNDLKALLPSLSEGAFKTLLSRAAKIGLLERVCRGIYVYKSAQFSRGLLLFHTAAHLRSSEINYISLETALSDAGIISQVPLNYISLMSSGRSSIISCGRFGTIEFVHTAQKPEDLTGELVYDADCRLWRASAKLALRDMKRTYRNCDLIDWESAHELIQ